MTTMNSRVVDWERLNMFWFYDNKNQECMSINEIENKNN